MADGVSLTIRNKDRLFAKLTKLVPAAAVGLTETNGQAAEQMVTLAQQYVPVKTGALRDSIVATPPGGTPPAYGQGAKQVPPGSWMVTAGSSAVRYGHLVEFGSKPHQNAGNRPGTHNPGAPAQPFFWPAYRIVRKGQKGRATRSINKAVKVAIK